MAEIEVHGPPVDRSGEILTAEVRAGDWKVEITGASVHGMRRESARLHTE